MVSQLIEAARRNKPLPTRGNRRLPVCDGAGGVNGPQVSRVAFWHPAPDDRPVAHRAHPSIQYSHKTRYMVASMVSVWQARGMDIETAARGLAELGNTTRLQIVRLLVRAGSEGLAIGELQSRLGVPASTLAFHLRGLVSARLVAQQRQGRVVRCTPLYAAINATLAFVQEQCCAGFDDMPQQAAAEDAPPSRQRCGRAA